MELRTCHPVAGPIRDKRRGPICAFDAPLWAGVRSEALSLGPAEGSLRVRVEAIESLGHEHLVYGLSTVAVRKDKRVLRQGTFSGEQEVKA